MAGTITVTEEKPFLTGHSMRITQIDWVSDAAGAVSGNATANPLRGLIYGCEFVPDSGGTQPTTLYDVQLHNANGRDLLAGNGSDRSNSAADWASASPYPVPVNSVVTPVISGAGDSKGGTIYIYHEGR